MITIIYKDGNEESIDDKKEHVNFDAMTGMVNIYGLFYSDEKGEPIKTRLVDMTQVREVVWK